MRDTEPQDQVRAFSVPVFCRRNNIGVTTAYRAHKADLLKFTKQFGKTVVTVEDEAEFRKLAAEGKLVWPEEMADKKPGPTERSQRKRGRPPRIGTMNSEARAARLAEPTV